jgi:hypothetical protein
VKHITLLALFLLIELASAQSGTPVMKDEAFGLTMHVMGNEVRFWVSDQDLDDSPEWLDPEAAAPPFSIADAVRVSKTELERYGVERAESWQVASVTIRRFQERPRWFYIVEWRPIERQVGDGLSIPVLMNGRALIGEIKPGSKVRKKTTDS